MSDHIIILVFKWLLKIIWIVILDSEYVTLLILEGVLGMWGESHVENDGGYPSSDERELDQGMVRFPRHMGSGRGESNLIADHLNK